MVYRYLHGYILRAQITSHLFLISNQKKLIINEFSFNEKRYFLHYSLILNFLVPNPNMNLDYPQDPNLWEKNKANKIKELTSREKYQKFYFFFVSGI